MKPRVGMTSGDAQGLLRDSSCEVRQSPRMAKGAELAVFGLIILAGLATRLDVMNRSLWLDEAWVANSVLAPSISEMMHYPKWVQSSPPLFLVLMRSFVKLAGTTEAAFRMVPWLAGAVSVLLMAGLLRKIFAMPLGLFGISFYLTNHWVAKYSQQVKQYSSDVLIAALFFLLLWNYLNSGPSHAKLWGLFLTGTIGVFLSYAVVFWLPAAVLIVALSQPALGTPRSEAQNRLPVWVLHCGTLLAGYAASSALAYFFFISPNRSANLRAYWADDYIACGGLLLGSKRFLENVCQLLLPRTVRGSQYVSYGLGLLILTALCRATFGAMRGDKRGKNILLISILPVVAAILTSLVQLYPLLSYPRFLIWMLPNCTVLLIYSVEPLWTWLTHAKGEPVNSSPTMRLVPALCLSAVIFNFGLVRHYLSEGEDFRGAFLYVKAHAQPEDAVFVHGGVAEQFDFYEQTLHWAPATMYLGNTEWACCARNKGLRTSNPRARNLAEDLQSFVAVAKGRRVWFMAPAGRPGHWSYGVRNKLDNVAAVMSSAGWHRPVKIEFGDVLLSNLSARLPRFRNLFHNSNW